MNTHTEKIKCPDCGTIQDAIVEHTIPFHTYLHNCEKCNFTIMESDWEVVKTTQQTAMQQLRNRLQARCESDSCSEYEEIILDGVINCIDTELLEIEKQQYIWIIQEAYGHGRDEADDVLWKQVEHSIQVILSKFNPK